MPNINDAKVVTGAATGKVISWAEALSLPVTPAQLGQIATFITGLGSAWPGRPQDVWALSVSRTENDPTKIYVSVMGYVVHNDATTAITTLTTPGSNVTRIVGTT